MNEEEQKIFAGKMKLRKETFSLRVADMKLFIKWALNKEVGKSQAVCIEALEQVLKELKGLK